MKAALLCLVCLLLAGCVSQPVAPAVKPSAVVKPSATVLAFLMPPAPAARVTSANRMTAEIVVPPPALTNALLSWDYGTNWCPVTQIFSASDLTGAWASLTNLSGTNFSTSLLGGECVFFKIASVVSVELAWEPSISTNVVAYKIYWGPSADVYTNTVSVGNVTNAFVFPLASGATYYFAATAIDAQGFESIFSNEAIWTSPSNAPTPLDFSILLK
jgi:hypothetical protein